MDLGNVPDDGEWPSPERRSVVFCVTSTCPPIRIEVKIEISLTHHGSTRSILAALPEPFPKHISVFF